MKIEQEHDCKTASGISSNSIWVLSLNFYFISPMHNHKTQKNRIWSNQITKENCCEKKRTETFNEFHLHTHTHEKTRSDIDDDDDENNVGW